MPKIVVSSSAAGAGAGLAPAITHRAGGGQRPADAPGASSAAAAAAVQPAHEDRPGSTSSMVKQKSKSASKKAGADQRHLPGAAWRTRARAAAARAATRAALAWRRQAASTLLLLLLLLGPVLARLSPCGARRRSGASGAGGALAPASEPSSPGVRIPPRGGAATPRPGVPGVHTPSPGLAARTSHTCPGIVERAAVGPAHTRPRPLDERDAVEPQSPADGPPTRWGGSQSAGSPWQDRRAAFGQARVAELPGSRLPERLACERLALVSPDYDLRRETQGRRRARVTRGT